MHHTETEIIKRIKRGDLNAFEELFRTYYAILCHYAKGYVKTKEQAEEIVQELFFYLWKNKEQLQIHTSFNAYLYKATYLNCMDFLRKQKVRNTFQTNSLLTETEVFTDTSLEEKEVLQIVQTTLKALPEKGRQIFNMSRFEGLKYSEIAEKLSISVKTVEANMGKALKLFRSNLKDYVGNI